MREDQRAYLKWIAASPGYSDETKDALRVALSERSRLLAACTMLLEREDNLTTTEYTHAGVISIVRWLVAECHGTPMLTHERKAE